VAGVDAPDLRVFVFALFFVFGGITSLNDVIIPKLKEIFVLTYAEAMLVQSAFFMAYFVFSIPAARVVLHVGYLRAAALGLTTMCAGCLLFMPASSIASFPVFLTALFVLAAGITVVQVVANPLIVLLGKPATAHSRLTFAQAFRGGAMVGRFAGSFVLRIFSPGKVLACVAATVLALSASSTGAASGWSLLAIGLCNSIMFPTIFSLASEGLGARAAEGSGIIATAIVGGAVVPLVLGRAADLTGSLKIALVVPALCYAVICVFGIFARRPHPALAAQAAWQQSP